MPPHPRQARAPTPPTYRDAPKTYFACGISGAIQHVVGVQADIVVAINRDANAPIFDIATYGIVGNVHEMIPVLIAEIRRRRG